MAATVEDPSLSKPNDDDINILLLGETGVGKSTFINSFVNYLQHTTFFNAMESELACLIPLKFSVPNEDFEDRVVEFGSDLNEDTVLGNSSTQGARGYLFPFENRNVRLIDTPGIGDARGIEQDDVNFENVLTYISQYKHLHGICFLLKPNVSVINAYFKFCIVHLLSRLDKSAAQNIIFIFTNSRGTFYRPGETLPLLRRILNEIKESPPHVEVPCKRTNMFCLDNEAFKFLIAKKNGIRFEGTETKEFAMSWKTSYKTCKEILSYICGSTHNVPLKPHEVQNTISVNKARKIITDLSKPLADVSDLIQDNLTVLKRHENSLQQENLSKQDLLSKLFVPTVELEVAEISQPVTVCSASKCSEIYTCGGLNKYHYKQRCHNPCGLSNVPKEIIGTPELLNCWAMHGTKCRVCGCDYTVHMHIYYESQIVHKEQEDKNIKDRIKSKDDEIDAITLMTAKLKQTSNEFEYEKEEISKCMAKFAHFLKENSISAYNDAYLDYLDYLIEREKLLGAQKDQQRINNYTSLKTQYEQEKRILDDILVNARKYDLTVKVVSESDIIKLVQNLYNLPHTGSQISHLHSIQQRSVQNSIYSQEYKYPKLMKTCESESSSSSDEDEVKDVDSLYNKFQNLIKKVTYSTKKKSRKNKKSKCSDSIHEKELYLELKKIEGLISKQKSFTCIEDEFIASSSTGEDNTLNTQVLSESMKMSLQESDDGNENGSENLNSVQSLTDKAPNEELVNQESEDGETSDIDLHCHTENVPKAEKTLPVNDECEGSFIVIEKKETN